MPESRRDGPALRVYKRKLPHWELSGSVYFLTFSTVPGLTLSAQAKSIVLDSLRFHDARRYTLFGAVVMDTHAHAILQPLQVPPSGATGVSAGPCSIGTFYSLSQITHSLKSYSAHRVNRLLQRSGSVWLTESYDRVIRDESDSVEKLRYIVGNPLKAGLVEDPEEYPWLYLPRLQRIAKPRHAGQCQPMGAK